MVEIDAYILTVKTNELKPEKELIFTTQNDIHNYINNFKTRNDSQKVTQKKLKRSNYNKLQSKNEQKKRDYIKEKEHGMKTNENQFKSEKLSIPTCFISYSRDSKSHINWVINLASDLQQKMGIKVIIDVWTLKYGSNITKFMEKFIAESNFIIMVLTKGYKEKANKVKGGVGYEKNIISYQIFLGNKQEKFIPILREKKELCLPDFCASKLYIDFSDDNDYEPNLELLARTIHNRPLHIPPKIGKNPFK